MFHIRMLFRAFDNETVTCYGTIQLDGCTFLCQSSGSCSVLWLLFLLPCLRAPGRGVPGFLAGLALALVVVSITIQVMLN